MEWLRYGKQYYPNRICMNNYTYQDIYSAVVNVATRLQALPDTRIAIVSDNSVTMAVLQPCYTVLSDVDKYLNR